MELMDIFLVPIRYFDHIAKSIRHVVQNIDRVHEFLVASYHSGEQGLQVNDELLLVVFFILNLVIKHLFDKLRN